MSTMKDVLGEFDSCLSYYPIVSFAIILGLSINFIFSIDFYYKDTLPINILSGVAPLNRALIHSTLILIYLAAQIYLALTYLSNVISLKYFIKEASKSNITVTTDIKEYIRTKMFNKFFFRLIAISISLFIIFSKTLFVACENLCSIHLIGDVHYIYATIFFVNSHIDRVSDLRIFSNI